MNQVLDVYLSEQMIGQLYLDDTKRYIFEYDSGWVENHNAQPLSVSLPVRSAPYYDEVARSFFANLLPEAELRINIARRLGLSEKNDFSLLEAVGGECAGAVSLFPHGQSFPENSNYKKLTEEELNELIERLPRYPMLAGEHDIRLSLAGVQNKLPVFFDNDTISLPMGTAASSHILKPPIVNYSDTVHNEYFCMQLALKVGLQVPETLILQSAKPLYLIKRYDRAYNQAGNLIRLAQEDFCQALGIPPDHKYEQEGGPSLKDCCELIRNYSIQPAKDLSAIVDWVIFNYLIGNADAHGKNISLMLTETGPKLAPFYDLMSTAVYPGLTEKMAMKIGGENRPEWMIVDRWEQFAKDTGIGFKLIKDKCLKMTDSLPQIMTELAGDVQHQYGECELIDEIIELIKLRSGKVTRLFK